MLNKSIKEIDHLKELKDKTKDVSSRNNSDNVYSYASNKIQSSNEIVGRESLNIYNKLGRKATIETKNNIIKGKNKISNIKDNKTIKNTNKGIMNTKNNIKSSNEVIKTSYKMKEHIVNISNKTYKGIKKTVKITINSVKSIIAGTKALISLLIAGGSIAIFIIVIICMIGLLLNSVFGIFFSNEKIDNSITMTSVISSLNQELNTKIDNIKKENENDDYEINYNIADWKNVLAVYSVMETNSNFNSSLAVLDYEKIKNISGIFWNMNQIEYSMKEEQKDSIEKKKVLVIDIKSKNIEDTMNYYNFSLSQKRQVEELLNSEYSSLWKGIINGNNVIIKGKYKFPVGNFYTITQFYSNTHKAIDIAANYGSNIYSISDGEVIIKKDGCIVGDLSCNGKGGNYVVIKHTDNLYYSVYMHLKSIRVKQNDKVSQGDIIGYMGNTGNVEPIPDNLLSKNGTHLHFVIYENNPFVSGNEIDPSYFFDLKNNKNLANMKKRY